MNPPIPIVPPRFSTNSESFWDIVLVCEAVSSTALSTFLLLGLPAVIEIGVPALLIGFLTKKLGTKPSAAP